MAHLTIYDWMLTQGIVWTAGGNNKLLYCGAQDQSVWLVIWHECIFSMFAGTTRTQCLRLAPSGLSSSFRERCLPCLIRLSFQWCYKDIWGHAGMTLWGYADMNRRQWKPTGRSGWEGTGLWRMPTKRSISRLTMSLISSGTDHDDNEYDDGGF